MNTLRKLAIAVICLAPVSSLAAASDVEFTGRYGGSNYSSEARLETPSEYGYVGGSSFVAMEGSGPEVLWSLRPSISYEYHWSGGIAESHIQTQSHIVCLGVSKTFTLGYARTSVDLAATHFSDTYDVLVENDLRANHVANTWGVSVGIDLRFKFFDHIDAVVGYEYQGREKPFWEAETSSGTPYSVEGRAGDHCISAGVSVILGGV